MSEVAWVALASLTVVTLRRIERILERQERARTYEALRHIRDS